MDEADKNVLLIETLTWDFPCLIEGMSAEKIGVIAVINNGIRCHAE